MPHDPFRPHNETLNDRNLPLIQKLPGVHTRRGVRQ